MEVEMTVEVGIKLGVYRRLDNRAEGLDDNSPRALELHNRRKEALHSIFAENSAFVVNDWGKTDDTKPHEFVELFLVPAGAVALHYAIVPGLKWVALKLAEKAVESAYSKAAEWIISAIRGKQIEHKVLDIILTLPDGTKISMDPPDRDATMHITFADGEHLSVKYDTIPD
jgi:hypothetical protein